MKKVYKDKKYFICRWDIVDWKFMKRRLNPMDTVESSNQYVSGMTVKNSHRVSLYNNR